ncbi:CDP-4-dehydro-6-deoxyglucose reductase [Halospina denitrificans]|uniref:CDP-4-dehydro-6-deoxyglucose reductase n=1 Tax=Halospina denitrificans TaxID=332522 RepID=A0A4V3ER22_9GAMM|nr:NAD(P)H-flavin reductase [Halospina denitrificans]TDT44318.1 CDP-4-dehydro-6-deoxyglucose reductase [Halospina denitrificans]
MDAKPQQPAYFTCHLNELGLIGEDIYQVRLEWPHERPVHFLAGQYLAVHLPHRDPSWFSIASAPGAEQLTLHIQAPQEWETAREIIDYLRKHGSIRVSMPYGEACLRTPPEQPLLLVVAGTGFAQAKSLVDFLRSSRMAQPVYLYWGARNERDMYLRELAERWEAEWSQFRFRPVTCEADNLSDCHHERLVEAILADGHGLDEVTVMACGSPAMVYSTLDGLAERGLDTSAFFSDVLQYAPRD